MDIREINITADEIEDILREANPGEPASLHGEACTIYGHSRPLILTGVAILGFVYPPAATAVSALIAILDKACKESD